MLTLGDVLNDRYRVDRLLEIGALEAQYVAYDLRRATSVTIIELLPQPELDPASLDELRGAFLAGAAKLAALDHPGIVPILDHFCCEPAEQDGDVPTTRGYLVTPTPTGQTISELVARLGQQPEDQVVAWGCQLLSALGYAHEQGIRHGDITPDNVLIGPDDQATLGGFEILALWRRNDPRTWTAKRVMGAPEYAPPECWGMRYTKIDPRSDLYSLGATLYHALTAEKPLTARERTSNPYEFLQVKALGPRVSEGTKAAVLKAMSLAPDRRFQSAGEMRAALQAPSPVGTPRRLAPPPALFLPSKRRPRRSRPLGLAAWLISILVVLLAVVVGMSLPSTREARSAADSDVAPEPRLSASEAAPAYGGSATELLSSPTAQAQARSIPSTATPQATVDDALGRSTQTPDLARAADASDAVPPPSWRLVVDDGFDDNSNAWLVSEYEDDWGSIQREVAGGLYQWTVQAAQPVGRWCTPDYPEANRDVSAFYASVDAQRLAGPQAAAYGMILRLTEGNYYQFSVRDDGYFQFSLWQAFGWQPVIDWTRTEALRVAEPNRLTVLAQDGEFDLYINGELADTAVSNEIPKGEVGLSIATAPNEEEAVFVFDNFELWRP